MRLVGMAMLALGLGVLLVGCASEPTASQSSTPAPSSSIVGDGTFVVGTDVEPGTYRSEGDLDGTCEWSRISTLDGVDAFDNRPGAPQTVQILAGDEAFKTEHCQDWQQVSPTP